MISAAEWHLTVLDDSGIIGIADVEHYPAFVGRGESFDAFLASLARGTENGDGIAWGTGSEEDWRLSVRVGSPPCVGFRDLQTVLRLSSGELVANELGTLYIDAERGEVTARREGYVRTGLPPGFYACRVVQMYYLDDLDDDASTRDADFVIELQLCADGVLPATRFTAIPWQFGASDTAQERG